jgi:hypothetical protein
MGALGKTRQVDSVYQRIIGSREQAGDSVSVEK